MAIRRANGLAWICATCPDDHFRDSSKAADYVDRALERRPNDPLVWDTCAAVLAEDDEFDDAIEWETASIDSKEISEQLRRDFEKRLTLYQQHLPYRDEPEGASSQLTASTAQPGK